MDRVSLREPHGRSNTSLSPRSQGHTWQSSQLPTPETSRSGYEPDEDDCDEAVVQVRSRDPERRMQPPSDSTTDISYLNSKRSSSRRDSCNLRAPDSPPYYGRDSQTLSLPPLKTILANGTSSPPSSPKIYNRVTQPLPQEPTYTSTTYKPPALYPHKKQRTDAILEPAPWVNRPNGTNSPSVFKPPFDPPSATKDAFSAPSVPLNPYLSSAPRRRSTHHRPTSPSPLETESNCRIAPNLTFHGRETQCDPYSRARYDQELERAYDGYCTSRTDTPYEIAVRTSCIDRDAASELGRTEYFHSHTSPNLFSAPYMTGQHALFLPGHGDYHLSKSRKRSNLPKESTDIMKQWFDQNIANPYPSEEQKAVFSNATGISMNQVSNWFINHRRRCPELRDKRERAKTRDDR